MCVCVAASHSSLCHFLIDLGCCRCCISFLVMRTDLMCTDLCSDFSFFSIKPDKISGSGTMQEAAGSCFPPGFQGDASCLDV